MDNNAYEESHIFKHMEYEKRRERVIIRNIGGAMRKIEDVYLCGKDDEVTIIIRRYVAIGSVLLCKGGSNTKRLFVKKDIVEELLPCNDFEKSFVIVYKTEGGKQWIHPRPLSELLPSLSYVNDTTRTFSVKKRGVTKNDGIRCLCIEPLPGYELWIDEGLIINDFSEFLVKDKDDASDTAATDNDDKVVVVDVDDNKVNKEDNNNDDNDKESDKVNGDDDKSCTGKSGENSKSPIVF